MTNEELAAELESLRDKLAALYGWSPETQADPRSVTGLLAEAAKRLRE